ncbi:MAG: DNA-binding response regulator [Candidatus Sericytochromatia bacterium]|nr:MAG: DNA-binding response regulator [Candidatus Sericytochromatia bacterium]
MNMKEKILIIEDDKDISSFIATELKYENYDIYQEYNGIKGLSKFREIKPDLVILDKLLPDLNGLEVCKRIRETSDTPVIILTALGEIKEKVEALDNGANDYIVKPFSLDELLARIRVQLRQKEKLNKKIFEYYDLYLDISKRLVKRNNKIINLTPKEFDILYLLIQNPENVVSKKDIIEKVWGWNFDGDYNILDVSIHNLRSKIETENLPKIIFNVRGIGYILKNSEN